MKLFASRIIGAAAIAAMMLPSGVMAQEARDFADKLSATFKSYSTFEIKFGSAIADGDNIILSDWDIEGVDGSRAQKILDGTVTFEGVQATANGGYTAERAVFNDIDFTDDGIRLEVRNIFASNIEIFADPDADILDTMMLYQGFSAGPVKVTLEDREVFRIDSIVSTSAINDDRNEYVSNYAISGIYGDLSQIDDSDMNDALKMFDLTEINASMSGDMAWIIDTGLLSIIDSSIDIDGVGELIINADILGYTLELAQSMQEQGKAMQEMDATSSQAEMAGMQLLMSMAAQLSVSDISIRFNDDSVTNNVLDFIAAEQGVSRKGFVTMALSILPSILGPLGMPALQEQVIEAATSFLTNPGNIEIKAEPAEPVPFMALFAATQNPSIANELLNISITANQ
ncbi:hypothetical protein MNBD_ALPHA11-1873 [hydrothermal vent metagenome]|uniref:Uncharacterized protein n=1 Tax=hydrothermal vent metagenome TaxID=652676 RepID=A0A3B0TLH9_9ZZZZ